MATQDKGKARQAAVDDELSDDDLDDVLAQFNNAPSAALTGKASSNVTPNTAGAYDRAMQPTSNQEDDEDEGADDDELEAMFASELAKEMEKMLGGLKPSNDNVPSGKPNTGKSENEPESEEERQFRETFEKILANSMKGGSGQEDGNSANGEDDDGDVDLEQLSKLMNGLGAGGLPDFDALTKNTPSSSASKAKTAQPQPPRTFEETIKATMSRLNESEASHQSKAKSADDPLAALMAQMEALGGGAGGGFPGMNGKDGDDEELPELLDGLMDQLMSKELLYEPITELRTKYPEYLNSGEGVALPDSERQRYKKQNDIVNSIAAIFEDPKYSDTDKDARERVSKLMQEMQEAGAPPKHLLGELGPAMALNADGTPNVDPEQCIIS